MSAYWRGPRRFFLPKNPFVLRHSAHYDPSIQGLISEEGVGWEVLQSRHETSCGNVVVAASLSGRCQTYTLPSADATLLGSSRPRPLRSYLDDIYRQYPIL